MSKKEHKINNLKNLFIVGIITVGLIIAYLLLSLFIKKDSENPMAVRIIDGDTIELNKSISPKGTLRLIGVDAPEKDECFYQDSINELNRLLLNKSVRIEQDINTLDEYGRALVYVFVGDVFVNEYLLQNGFVKFGLDRINQKYLTRLITAANDGYKNKTGLWTSCAVSGTGCVIKGNLDYNDKKYYHLPTFRHYSTTIINFDHGDQWFCTEEEAQKAKFQRAQE
ncbi:thermonuclease family protein [Candidatus Roizmanbacteria bacterium]|nr:thermonuclease family protein [Candidatus Roizmanbacteria bacterium]